MPWPRTLVLSVCLALAAWCTGCGVNQVYHVEHAYGVHEPQFARTMGNLLGPPIVPGNRVYTLVNGDQIFPEMLATIRMARRTITMETYVFWSGTISDEFTDALAERAAHGVRVHLIIDAIGGSKIDAKDIKELEDAGVEVVSYHAVKWYDAMDSTRTIDNRTHRKLLIIDGEIGFTGGVGIAEEWRGHAQDPDHWRDTHYRVEGPAVAQLQAAFMDDWMESTGQVLHSEDYFPPLKEAGSMPAQMFKSSFRGGNDSMRLLYLLSMSAAEHRLRLCTPYFVPDKQTIDTLLAARERGVDVRIIVPGPHIDERIVRHASRATWGRLLKAGVHIYEYQPTMYHCKLMIVDGLWSSIGSSNLDPRSFGLNCEANLNVLDRAFAEEQERVFEDDLAHSREITYEEWENRPFSERFLEWWASLLKHEL